MKKTQSRESSQSNSSINLWGLKVNFSNETDNYRLFITLLMAFIIILVILLTGILVWTGHWQIPTLGGIAKIIYRLTGRSP